MADQNTKTAKQERPNNEKSRLLSSITALKIQQVFEIP